MAAASWIDCESYVRGIRLDVGLKYAKVYRWSEYPGVIKVVSADDDRFSLGRFVQMVLVQYSMGYDAVVTRIDGDEVLIVQKEQYKAAVKAGVFPKIK